MQSRTTFSVLDSRLLAAMLSPKDLEHFLAAYETRSFVRAGARLSTAPSNVSFRVRRLETDLATLLFKRRRYGVEPTEKGEQLYQFAKRVESILGEAERTIREKAAV